MSVTVASPGGHWRSVVVLIAVAVALGVACLTPPESRVTRDISTVVQDAAGGNVRRIQLDGDEIRVELNRGSVYYSRKEAGSSFVEILRRSGVDPATVPIDVKSPSSLGGLLQVIFQFLPILIFGGFILLILRSRGGTSQALGFTKSRARLVASDVSKVTFADVAGIDEAKQDLQEIVDFLKNPEKYRALGAHIPRGVLLLGPPGTGKTLLARAVAGEAGVPFFSVSGSEFVEMFVGVGAARVRDLFAQAKERAPCIAFIDEIDAVGRQRGAGLGTSNDEREQTLNQILVEMDGFEGDTNVIVLAATNRPDVLDAALLRPGRFDRQVIIDSPDVKGRIAILQIHLRGKPLAEDVSVETLAKRTPAFSGADLANIVNEAAIVAVRAQKQVIGMDQFEEAIDRVTLGPDHKSRIRGADETRRIAYHEAGHALVAHGLEDFDRLYKITIVPRGKAAGTTLTLPSDDIHVYPESYLEHRLALLLGGHVAEEIVFGEASTAASDDLEKITDLARAMVTRFGMTRELGPQAFDEPGGLPFTGRGFSGLSPHSEKLAAKIDNAVLHLLDRAHEKARQILLQRRGKLDELAEKLIETETLAGDDLLSLLSD